MATIGTCHLCGEQKLLTYEHLPAKSSFNRDSVDVFGFDSWIGRAADGSMTGGVTMPEGAGAHTLCYECNSPLTGNHYVGELKRWTAAAMSIAAKELSHGADGNAIHLRMTGVYPSRILKQIVAMLASVNSASMLEHHKPLREFVLNPHSRALPSRYQFYVFMAHPKSTIARYAGLSIRLASGTWCGTLITDLVWPPFGYVMTIDEQQPWLSIGNVSSFADYDYDQAVDVDLRMPILITEEPYPGEFVDPVAGGAFSEPQRLTLPTAESVRIPVQVRLADGYQMDGAELAHSVPFVDLTAGQLREVLEALLRVMCVRSGEEYEFNLKWIYGRGAVLTVESGLRKGVTDWLPVRLSDLAEFVGHETVPNKGTTTHRDVMRFEAPNASSISSAIVTQKAESVREPPKPNDDATLG